MRASRASPSPTRYTTNDRPSTAQDNPQVAPLNPAIADDQNAQENPPATRIDQTEGQGRSVFGDRETRQPASSVPATATHSTEASSAARDLLADLHDVHQFLTERHWDPSTVSNLVNFIAGLHSAPRSGQAEVQVEGPTLNPEGLNASDHDDFTDPSAEGSNRETFPQEEETDFLDRLSGGTCDTPAPLNERMAVQRRNYHSVDEQGLLTAWQSFQSEGLASASTATADDPSIPLSKALDLDQGFCESPEWQHLAKTQDLALLAKLVTRSLRGAKNPNLKPMLRHLVEEMAAKPALAERVFIVLLGGDASCDDGVSLALGKAQEEWLAQPVWDGALNDDLPKMIEIARQVFRRRVIDELARHKVNDINKERRAANLPEHDEEVETHLAYLAGLHESLELGGEKPDALFTRSSISSVTFEDIEVAKRAVLTQEGERFWDFVATWEPWQEVVLRARYQDEVAEIKKVLSDPDRPARLHRKAATAVDNAGVPIEFREDAITRTANQLGQDEALQLWLELTKRAWSSQ
ncbi:NEL-type E3 ubiquitin ligase domain-containing protein [Variovorax sp. DT-64]|uniref:NEL-type E3 ubiquitin ligase domain-containing protein n=1 Tax=Variovorax sp. DT-64 TaxID=3396160 RepID=UPI003F1AE687